MLTTGEEEEVEEVTGLRILLLLCLSLLLIRPLSLPLLLRLSRIASVEAALVAEAVVARLPEAKAEESPVRAFEGVPLPQYQQDPHYQLPVPLPSISSQTLPVGGRLQAFHQQWESMGAEKFVVKMLREGYRLRFHTAPMLSERPCVPSDSRNPQRDQLIQDQLDILLQKQAIEVVPGPSWDPGFYSRLFTVPKPNGKVRPIIDLKILNKNLIIPRFKMESIQTIWTSLTPGSWTFSIDMSDAYFHVPIHKASRRYLRMYHRGVVYQFRALPFGLSTAPWVFTRVVTQVKVLVQLQGIHLMCYLDDWLVQVLTYQLGLIQSQYMTNLCQALGFLINWEKSELVPSQTFNYIGARWNLITSKVFPLDINLVKMKSVVSHFLQEPNQTARSWQSLIGTLNSMYRFITWGRIYLRPLQWHLLSVWSQHKDPPFQIIVVPQSLHQYLNWWLQRSIDPEGVSLLPLEYNYHLYTDASGIGWGGHAEGVDVNGPWSGRERTLFINVLEMRAVINSLIALQPQERTLILVASDNRTVVSYVNRMGGTKSWSMMEETYDLFSLCIQKDWRIRARYIPGHLNCIADQLSRTGQPLPTEWSLNPLALERIFRTWHRPQLDLFATRYNKKLDAFVSPSPDAEAVGVDGLTFPIDGLDLYAYPPRTIMSSFLHRFQRAKSCSAIVIASLWPNQPWYPLLRQLAVEPPIPLPAWETLITQPISGKPHPLPSTLNLHAWKLISKR